VQEFISRNGKLEERNPVVGFIAWIYAADFKTRHEKEFLCVLLSSLLYLDKLLAILKLSSNDAVGKSGWNVKVTIKYLE
jgi:hypothetical protein